MILCNVSGTDLNYCGTHEPCQHGGTCENTAPDQYLCTCAEGFSGVDCERVDNPCAPQPCAHGACSLAAAPAGFACACERGWAGARCDEDEDDCASAPCRNGAVCRDRLAAFQCECAPGWAGPTCADGELLVFSSTVLESKVKLDAKKLRVLIRAARNFTSEHKLLLYKCFYYIRNEVCVCSVSKFALLTIPNLRMA